jgi:hypothetical protein
MAIGDGFFCIVTEQKILALYSIVLHGWDSIVTPMGWMVQGSNSGGGRLSTHIQTSCVRFTYPPV